MTIDEILLAKIKAMADESLKRKITTLNRRLAKMEALKDSWREMALRREVEIKELKEQIRTK